MRESSIADIQQSMSSGERNAAEITAFYLDRIRRYDGDVRSVIEINPEAGEISDALDAERATFRPRGPLHGIPILIKDNIDTADGMQTTAGSLALAGSPAAGDAFIVKKLREAGAVILGKTNLSEWANFRSTHSTSGWSSRGGQTRNPYALDRSPCGSSSGSGAAAAADFCAAAVGTETDGSIVCPSAINGIVGIKPTVGLVSRSGIIPISHSQDTAGPMARTVADAAALLSVLAGPDPEDPVTTEHPASFDIDYTQYLDADSLGSARIGVATNYLGYLPAVDRVFENAVETLREHGAVIIEDVGLESSAEFRSAEHEVLRYEFKHGLNHYLADRRPGAAVRSLEDVIRFNEGHSDQVMPYFDQEIHLQAQAKGPLTETTYLEALARCREMSRAEGIDRVLAEHNLDAILAPSNAPAWLIDWVRGDFYGGGSSSYAAVAGYPAITVPAGYVMGLPVGITLFGPAWSEPALIRLAYAFEQATQVRVPPRFSGTVEFSKPAFSTHSSL